jgi:hypothetical protein
MTTAETLPVRPWGVRGQLRANDREGSEGTIDEVLLQLLVVLQRVAKDCREQKQKWKQREEAVVGDERRLTPRLIIAELL